MNESAESEVLNGPALVDQMYKITSTLSVVLR